MEFCAVTLATFHHEADQMGDIVTLRHDKREVILHGDAATAVIDRWRLISRRYGATSPTAQEFICKRVDAEIIALAMGT
jgi:hypothetical protein